MQIKRKSYPYPVLVKDSDDYIGSKFIVHADKQLNGYNLLLNFSIELENEKLLELIKSGYATVVFHIENSLTGFRKWYETDNTKHRIEISINKLKETVEICSFIVAKKDISNYSNTSFNPDYGENASFDIEKGCVLAVGNQFELQIPKIKDELKDRPSFISIIGKDDIDCLRVDVDHTEKLVIQVPKESFNKYRLIMNKPEIRNVLISIIIVPGLVSALDYLKDKVKEGNDEFDTELTCKGWVQALDKTFKNKPFEKDLKKELSDMNTFEWAQKLINEPIKNCMKELYEINSVEASDEN